MPNTAFDDPVIRQNGELFVTGPVVPATSAGQRLEREITIRFLVHQQLVQGQPPVILDEVARYAPPVPGTWEFTFPPGHGIVPGRVRGIGVAIFRWDIDPDDPNGDDPAFEVYTWCVRRDAILDSQAA